MYDALHYLLDDIFIRFGWKLYRHSRYSNGYLCAPLVADNNQTDIIEAFNSTSRYLDDLLNIDNPYIEHMVGQINPNEL